MSNQKIDWGEKQQVGKISIDKNAKSYGAEEHNYITTIQGWTCPRCKVVVTTLKDKKIHQIRCLGNRLKPKTTLKRTPRKSSNRTIRKKSKTHNYGVKSLEMLVKDGMATTSTIERDGKTITITTLGIKIPEPIGIKKLNNMDINLKNKHNIEILQNVIGFNKYKKRNRK